MLEEKEYSEIFRRGQSRKLVRITGTMDEVDNRLVVLLEKGYKIIRSGIGPEGVDWSSCTLVVPGKEKKGS